MIKHPSAGNSLNLLSVPDIYQKIPEEFYRAVAEILVFVYALNMKADFN